MLQFTAKNAISNQQTAADEMDRQRQRRLYWSGLTIATEAGDILPENEIDEGTPCVVVDCRQHIKPVQITELYCELNMSVLNSRMIRLRPSSVQ